MKAEITEKFSKFKSAIRGLFSFEESKKTESDSENQEKTEKPKKYKRTKTPTVLQMEAVECGAACLAMVLSYFGRIETLEKLRVECGISRDGSKASNIVKAARRFGLEAKGFRKEPDALLNIKPPMILFWNFNHFVVFEGFKKGFGYINDPGSGPRTVTQEELDEAFTGVVLTFEKGPEFKKGGEDKSLFAALGKRLVGSKAALLYVVLAGLALVPTGLLTPTFSKIFVDDILVGGKSDWLQPMIMAMGLMVIVTAFITWLQHKYLLKFETKLSLSSSSKFFWHVLRLPIEFFSQRHAGEIGSRVSVNAEVADLLSGQLSVNFLNLILIVFYGALLFYYDPVLTLIGTGIALLNILALKIVSKKRELGNQKLLQDQGKLVGTSMNGLQTIESLKASGAESDFFEKWSGFQTKALNAQQELGVPTNILNAIPSFLTSINTMAILSIGALRVMTGHLSMGTLIAFQALMKSFIEPVTEITQLGAKLQEVKGDMNRLDDVHNYPVDIQTEEKADEEELTRKFGKLTGYVELKNITFGYSRLEKPLIEDFSLSLKPGDRVALVGGSGSGKSTVAKILAGLYLPWEGEILFDRKPRQDIPRGLINNSLAMVDQDIALFSGAIKDNLTLWSEDISQETYVQAAKDACIHYDVAEKPNGYDYDLSEGGQNFSGGQRQRLEIARALSVDPSIVIFDEATSALDPKIEMLVDGNIRRRGCTCIIVAHRLSTIRDCDEIIVMEKGKVVQRGTHDEMKDVEGPYYDLIRI